MAASYFAPFRRRRASAPALVNWPRFGAFLSRWVMILTVGGVIGGVVGGALGNLLQRVFPCA